jgi:hypothetical protein
MSWLMDTRIADTLQWLRANDLPNWLAFSLTVILWPLALVYWQRRKVHGVPGLEAHFKAGSITIDGKPFAAIDIQFTNHTGSVTYLSGVRIRKCSKAFFVPPQAARDIAGDSYHLKFMDAEGRFVLREITLQTNQSAKTCMPSAYMPLEFFQHSGSWLARKIGLSKYFILEYTAMVGTARHLVSTVY